MSRIEPPLHNRQRRRPGLSGFGASARRAWRRHRLALLIAGVLLMVLILNTPDRPYLQPSGDADAPRRPAIPAEDLAIPRFDDHTLTAGITTLHWQGDETLTSLNEVLGPGACAFDYDNDGWVDLFIVGSAGQTHYYGGRHWWNVAEGHALYRNLGNGRFQNVSARAGIKKPLEGMGCVAADLDNDGDQDLLVTGFGANALYRNDGNGIFSDITPQAGLEGDRWSTSAAVADFDRDGRLDIYVTNYIRYVKGAYTYEKNSQFVGDLPPAFDASLYDAQANHLYRNLGGLKFQEVSAAAGVDDASGRGLSAVWLDVNEDQWPDLFVANDKGFPNSLFINLGNGKFKESGIDFQVNDARGSTGVVAGDTDNDGHVDLMVSSIAGHPLLLLRHQGSAAARFQDVARAAGVGDERLVEFSHWGAGLIDFNNDGRLDLFMANGLALPDPDSRRLPLGQPKQLWLNRGGNLFHDVSGRAGRALGDALSGRGATFADFDNDGDIDVFVAHNNDLGQLLINTAAPAHWLGIQLEARRGNRDAIGARVWLRTAGGVQMRASTAGSGFLSDSDRRLHFGLGNDTEILELRVRWPDGSEEIHRSVPSDRYVKIVQGEAGIAPLAQAQPAVARRPALRLRVGADDAQRRRQYLHWIMSAKVPMALLELEATLKDRDAGVRLTAITLLGEYPQQDGLRLLIDALQDPAPENRAAAVASWKNYEDEGTVRWLLRLFNDPDANVRRAVAEAFAFFFEEEEAVIHRKYLAVPYLVRMLQDPKPAARIAALRALAEAERYRAVDPTIALLKDRDIAVRTQAVRTLGLLRERKAIAPLLKLLADPVQPPVVRAHTLIALKRLEYERLDDALRGQIAAVAQLEVTLRTFKAILEDAADGVVLNREQLTKLILVASLPILVSSDNALIKLFIDTLAATNSRQTLDQIKSLSAHADPSVRTAAYRARMQLDVAARAAVVTAALNDSDLTVRLAALQAAHNYGVLPPLSSLLSNLERPETKRPGARLLARYSEQAGPRLLALANEPDDGIRLAVLEGLVAAKQRPFTLPQNLLGVSDRQLRAAALQYATLAQPSATLLEQALQDPAPEVRAVAAEALLLRHEAWAQAALKRFLLNEKSDRALRQKILEGLAQSGRRDGMETLLQMARLRHDPLSLVALECLGKYTDAKADALLWEILNNRNETAAARFAAAKALQPRHARAVLAILRQE